MLTFTATGHENVLCLHRNTIEFTHDKHLTLRGDCILAINAKYSLEEIKKANFEGKIKIKMTVEDIDGKNIEEEIIAVYNPQFNNPHEMVIRRTDFKDQRTFATYANKVAKDIRRDLVAKMMDPSTKMVITIAHFSE